MTTPEILPVDINTAGLDQLARIPGMGLGRASRLLQNRPYNSIDELIQLKGFGSTTVNRMRAYLFVDESALILPTIGAEDHLPIEAVPGSNGHGPMGGMLEELRDGRVPAGGMLEDLRYMQGPPPNDMANDDIADEWSDEASEPDTGFVPITEAEPQTEADSRQSNPREQPLRSVLDPRQRLFTLVWVISCVLTGLFSAFLGVGLTLGLLALFNGGLNYVPQAQYIDQQNRIAAIESSLQSVQTELQSIGVRIDNLATISNRISGLESESAQLGAQIDTVSGHLDEIRGNLTGLDTRTQNLEERSSAYERFFAGLQDLLGTLKTDPAAIP